MVKCKDVYNKLIINHFFFFLIFGSEVLFLWVAGSLHLFFPICWCKQNKDGENFQASQKHDAGEQPFLYVR